MNALALKLPQNISVCGNTLCGKSFLTNQMLHATADQWDVLVVLSPTIKLSQDFSDFRENADPKRGKVVYKFADPSKFGTALTDVVEQQESIITNDDRKYAPQVVCVLDDMVGHSMLRFRGPIDKLSTKSRHLNISLVVLSQRISAIPRTFRLNTRTFIIFSIANFSELERMLEETVPKTFRNRLREHINEIYDEPYNYIQINMFAPRISERMFRNGTENLYALLGGKPSDAATDTDNDAK